MGFKVSVKLTLCDRDTKLRYLFGNKKSEDL